MVVSRFAAVRVDFGRVVVERVALWCTGVAAEWGAGRDAVVVA